jgi:hypothetical protein
VCPGWQTWKINVDCLPSPEQTPVLLTISIN